MNCPSYWAKDALAPVISEETINFHYGKHHKAYVDKTKELIAGTDLEDKTLEEIIIAAQQPARKSRLCLIMPARSGITLSTGTA